MIITAPIENKEASSYKLFSNVDLTQQTINFFNSKSDSFLANSVELVGGNREEWNEIIENISQHHVEQTNPYLDWEDMEALDYNVDKKRKYYPPYTLDPEQVTFEDIRSHAITRQNIAESTTTKYINLAKLMETHPVFPVNFKNPHWTNFFQYMDHIKTNEYIDKPHALKNRCNAWAMFCKAWGTHQEWPKYKPPHVPDRSRDIVLPMPEKVNEILSHKYTKDVYLNKLIQYHFFTGFMVGMRPEKEMVILNVDDLTLDNDDFYTIRIVEPKKHGNTRILKLENMIAAAQTNKCFKNYVNKIRPRFANRNEDALLINPNDGKRWTEANLRKTLLTKYGCIVWPRFWPYVMRHWCATARCIEWKKDNTVLYRVKDWMGHKKTDQTLKYIQLASLYSNNSGSWLSRALKRRRCKTVGGKHGQIREKRITQKNRSFVKIPPRKLADAAAIEQANRRNFSQKNAENRSFDFYC